MNENDEKKNKHVRMGKEIGRIQYALRNWQTGKRKALTVFLTAGYPKRDATVDIVRAVEDGGADMIEIGMPFSDPLADGPVIQHSSAVSLSNGTTLQSIFEDVEKIRSASAIPIILMGYINPILRYGPGAFFRDAAKAGVDGMILPELPIEESTRFQRPMQENELSQILLVAPTSSPERMEKIDNASEGFVYCVSTTGVTGISARPAPAGYLSAVKRHVTKNPVLVGFGIRTPDDAKNASQIADGVIVGSAFLQKLDSGASFAEISSWVYAMKSAMSV